MFSACVTQILVIFSFLAKPPISWYLFLSFSLFLLLWRDFIVIADVQVSKGVMPAPSITSASAKFKLLKNSTHNIVQNYVIKNLRCSQRLHQHRIDFDIYLLVF
jgi:hypothetical protein